MSKSSSVFTRVAPELKEKAESILTQLGIPMSNAINLFLRQIVLQKGIPFDVKLPQAALLDMSSLSQGEFDAEIQKGIDDLESGKIISAGTLRKEMQRD